MVRTRTETFNGTIYCAYCGKILNDGSSAISCYPEQPLTCDCEKAKQELRLYDELKALYNSPLAENLIEKKVEIYRNSLLGKSELSSTITYNGSGLVKKLMAKDEYSGTSNTFPNIPGVIGY